jgi:three-Cys-motif partner protein
MTDKSSEGIPEGYDNREHAYVKHLLLKEYLQKLFLIIGRGSEKSEAVEICYVDCFAGPWLDKSEGLGTTSIAISLDILKRSERQLQNQRKLVKLRALYVEKDKEAFARLEQHLQNHSPKDLETKALKGDFVELRQEILEWCGKDSFAFFFIDPKGWTVVQVDVLDLLLRRPRSEFLINFMYDSLNRFVEKQTLQNQIMKLFGEAPNVDGLTPAAREKQLLLTYRKNLKKSIPSNKRYPARSAYVRIRDPEKDRTKYHLVYLTSHPVGIIEFMEISEKVDLVQKQVRATTKQNKRIEKSGQKELFGSQEFVSEDEGHATPEEVEKFWLTKLSSIPRKLERHDFADLIEETDWFPGDLQEALGRLMAQGKVRNLDAKGKRRSQFLHYKIGERLQLIGDAQ